MTINKLNDMQTKKIITKSFPVLVIILSFWLHSCEREEWCAFCEWTCTSFDPWFGSKTRTICADSRLECEESVQDFVSSRFASGCWECTEPYIK